MQTQLKIELANLPEEGIYLQGELAASVLKTEEQDLAQADSPLYYDIHAQRFDNELLVRGFLETTLKMTCVRSNKKFLETFTIEEFAASVEIDSGQIDITDVLREELFIEVPSDPICEEAYEKSAEDLISRYLAVDKPHDDGVNEPPAAEESPKNDKEWSNNWDALNKLDNFPDKQD